VRLSSLEQERPMENDPSENDLSETDEAMHLVGIQEKATEIQMHEEIKIVISSLFSYQLVSMERPPKL
jgi:hypothetical protein